MFTDPAGFQNLSGLCIPTPFIYGWEILVSGLNAAQENQK